MGMQCTQLARYGGYSLLLFFVVMGKVQQVEALPPPEDSPEEVLRTEIVLDGRSPITGRPLSAANYAELEARLEAELRTTPILSPRIREIFFLLSILRGARLVFPFLP